MTDLPEHPELEGAAKDAVNSYVSRSLVFLIWGPPDHVPSWFVATGILLKSSDNCLIVVTAKHNLEDIRSSPYQLGYWRCTDTLKDPFMRTLQHPDPKVDVGFGVVRHCHSHVLTDLAIELESIAEDSTIIEDRHWLVLAGFPSELVNKVKTPRPGYKELLELGLTSMCYLTGLHEKTPDAEGRLQVKWTEYQIDKEPAKPMPRPAGISGGALWRFQAVPPRELWLPAKAGKVIGIPVAWDRHEIEYVEPVQKWRPWLADEIARLGLNNT